MTAPGPGPTRRGAIATLGAATILPWRAMAQPARAGALHALLVGINAYRKDPLLGCVNDARLLEAALRPFAASMTLLLDRQATRAGFDRAWAEVTSRCRAGDTLWFSFSGHGSRMDERGPCTEQDCMDDFLVFAPFHEREAPREMLIDNEINVLLADLGRRGIAVVFAADCCHAGTLTRSVRPAAQRSRRVRTLTGSYSVSQLLNSLAAEPPPPPEPPQDALAHVHFFAAGLETEEVPEIIYRDRPHGALSVALATGLSGAAQADRSGEVTVPALAAHALATVRALAEAQQTPDFVLGPRAPVVLLRRAPAGPPALREPAEPPLRLHIDGIAPAGFAPPPGAVLATDPAEAELIWRPAAREIIGPLGDLLSAEAGPPLLPAAVARQRAVRRVQAWVTAGAIEIRVERRDPPAGPQTRSAAQRRNNAAHPRRTPLRLMLEGVRLPNLVVFNLAGDGTVQALYPNASERPVTPPDGRLVVDDIEVKPPFGADHVIAFAAERPLQDAAAALAGLDGTRAPLAAVEALAAAAEGGAWRVGLTGLFTREA
ncbi:caspase family protein [Falsiroseomonas stagni]|uniref:Caspase domain-containing protein n=1 Tax=Falsiroseomonas stagni DSM 19981 TaxID=1123062 RepID=A0A1I4F5A0_9PROT|nr:caspase family protein [Falsiroseomonas stagni]SFL13162.1 Caspase domain-containing protein [Falsiroseomonas stagni DSM 19981]